MKPILRILLRSVKIVAIVVVAVIILAVAAVWLLNMPSVQNKILAYATEMLEEELQTKVEIDSIRVGFFVDDVRLYNLRVEDREHRPMLRLEHLSAEIDMWALLSKEVQLKKVSIDGLHAQLFKAKTDSVANYQFVLDAFKPTKKKKKGEKKESKKLTYNLNELHVADVDVAYNESRYTLGRMNVKKGWNGKYFGELHKIETSWTHVKKRKSVRVDNHLLIDRIVYGEEGGRRQVLIDSIHWTTNNHLPHKHVFKPKQGWFDDGHLNVVARLRIDVDHADKDSICGALTECDANDKTSGLHINDLHLKFKQADGKVHVSDATICLANTKLQFAKGELQLRSKKLGRPFLFSTSNITGTTRLADIAHPFAPVLKGFNMPLRLSTKFSGTDSTLTFRDVVVKTTDNLFQVKASGGLEGLKDKHKLNVHFNILECVAKGDSKARIINQFTVRKFMMKQLQNLGTLRYRGSLNVRYKREEFRGNLGTDCGDMQFSFLINELEEYLTGNVQSDEFELGKVMDDADLGKIGCRADFKVDISKKRTAEMRRQKGGNLPIGQVNAHVMEAKYKGIKVTEVFADIVSDGAVAEGNLKKKGKFADILCSFSFTDMNDMKKMKVKPGIRFHLFHSNNSEDKADRDKQKAERKEAKRLKREAKKQQRATAKAAKDKG